MNAFSSYLIIVLFLALTAFIGAGCKTFFSSPQAPKKIKIADKKQINQNWLEIIPPAPLEATAKIHFIGLKIKDVKGWADETKQSLLLADGRKIKIEIELIEENGRSTFLFPNGFGELVEFGKRVENKENIEESYFQIGAKFDKLRLRSDKTIDIEEFTWMEFEF